jgi:glycosyltransferase involved in cell wall biosynthesis
MLACSEYEIDARVRGAAETLTHAGNQVDLLCLGRGTSEASNTDDSLRIFRFSVVRNHSSSIESLAKYALFFMWALAFITVHHLRRRYDIVYVHNMPNFLVFTGVLPKLTGAKAVIDVHDPTPELLMAVCGDRCPGWLIWVARAEERVSLRYADAVVTVNEQMRKRLVGIVRKDTPVIVVMNLPDPKIFSAQKAARTSSDRWLVYCGTISHRHGVDLAVRALALVKDEFPTLRLRILGSGPMATSIPTWAEQLGVKERVEVIGQTRLEDLPNFIGGASAGLALHRKDSFGSLVFSVKVAEYVSLGVPVVCSRLTTMCDYFGEDELYYFDPGNVDDLASAIRSVLSDSCGVRTRLARSQHSLEALDRAGQRAEFVQTVESLVR